MFFQVTTMSYSENIFEEVLPNLWLLESFCSLVSSDCWALRWEGVVLMFHVEFLPNISFLKYKLFFKFAFPSGIEMNAFWQITGYMPQQYALAMIQFKPEQPRCRPTLG